MRLLIIARDGDVAYQCSDSHLFHSSLGVVVQSAMGFLTRGYDCGFQSFVHGSAFDYESVYKAFQWSAEVSDLDAMRHWFDDVGTTILSSWALSMIYRLMQSRSASGTTELIKLQGVLYHRARNLVSFLQSEVSGLTTQQSWCHMKATMVSMICRFPLITI